LPEIPKDTDEELKEGFAPKIVQIADTEASGEKKQEVCLTKEIKSECY